MPNITLTSLAMLKVHVDQGDDYLVYLRPFVLQVLVTHRPDIVTDVIVRDLISADFGLEIPERAVQVVLKRLPGRYPMKKKGGIYRIIGELPDPRIDAKRGRRGPTHQRRSIGSSRLLQEHWPASGEPGTGGHRDLYISCKIQHSLPSGLPSWHGVTHNSWTAAFEHCSRQQVCRVFAEHRSGTF